MQRAMVELTKQKLSMLSLTILLLHSIGRTKINKQAKFIKKLPKITVLPVAKGSADQGITWVVVLVSNDKIKWVEDSKTTNLWSSATPVMKVSLDATKLMSLKVTTFWRSLFNIFVKALADSAFRAWLVCKHEVKIYRTYWYKYYLPPLVVRTQE